jgi:hypothetical protein
MQQVLSQLADVRNLTIGGLLLVAAGYALRMAGFAQAHMLIHPLWFVGLAIAFYALAREWQWRGWEGHSRISTFVLGAGCLMWGNIVSEGTFLAVGGLALFAWTYTVLLESIPDKTEAWFKLVLVGSLTVLLAWNVWPWVKMAWGIFF